MAKKMYFCSPPQCLQMTNTADYICTLISELLYEHRQLHLPDLGAFLLQYKPAVVDNVQGQLLPPSLDLSFDTNLVLDDGLLQEQLQQRTGWSAEVASQAIGGFVAEIRAQLSRGELVHLPNIGRLYSNHENAIVFKADPHNYHKDAFGLPVIQATVAARPAAASATAATAAATATNPARSAAKGGSMGFWFLVFGLLALLTGGMIYARIYVNRLATERAAAKVAAAEADAPPLGGRVNVAPSADLPEEPAAKGEAVDQQQPTAPADQAATKAQASQAAGPANGSTASAAKAEAPPAATRPAAAKPAPAAGTTAKTAKSPAAATTVKPAPAGKTVAWISVGKFGDADNAARMNQRIAAAGYEPFSTEEDGLTRVGVLLTFSTEAELQQQLAKVRRTFATNAFVVKREQLRN